MPAIAMSYQQALAVATRIAPISGRLVHFDNGGMVVMAPDDYTPPDRIVFAAQRNRDGGVWVRQIRPVT